MGISFESLISDIAGRSGRLVVGRKTVKTPALLPVINPHLQLITPKELQAMGVEALITNAYIFSQSRQFRDRALSEGLHRVLDFDGVIMTDSGSFQLSVYGQVSVTNTETLSFQRDIRSDIWVPLDIPTSPSADRATTERELAITMQRLKEAKEVFGSEAPIAGPVQGGIFEDLRERAGREVTDLGFSFCPSGRLSPSWSRTGTATLSAWSWQQNGHSHHLPAFISSGQVTRPCLPLRLQWAATFLTQQPMPCMQKTAGT